MQRVLVEVRREPDVGRRERRRERMHGAVEPPRRAVHPPAFQHREREAALRLAREPATQARVVDGLGLLDRAQPREQRSLQRVEDRDDLVRLHPRLVVVEDDVVRIAVGLEAGDVPPAQLEIALEVRQHDRVVLLLARAEPALVSERAGARHLGAQLRGHADRLLVVAARDADEACLERLEVVLLLEWAQLLEELAEVGRDVELVGDPVEGRALLRARLGAARRHLRLLVPGEDARRFLNVVDLCQAPPEVCKLIGQRRVRG